MPPGLRCSKPACNACRIWARSKREESVTSSRLGWKALPLLRKRTVGPLVIGTAAHRSEIVAIGDGLARRTLGVLVALRLPAFDQGHVVLAIGLHQDVEANICVLVPVVVDQLLDPGAALFQSGRN